MWGVDQTPPMGQPHFFVLVSWFGPPFCITPTVTACVRRGRWNRSVLFWGRGWWPLTGHSTRFSLPPPPRSLFTPLPAIPGPRPHPHAAPNTKKYEAAQDRTGDLQCVTQWRVDHTLRIRVLTSQPPNVHMLLN